MTGSCLIKSLCLIGMADVTCDNVVRLNKYIDYSDTYVWEGAFGRIANTYVYNFTKKDISPAENPSMLFCISVGADLTTHLCKI